MSKAKSISLSDYRKIVCTLPRPTSEQIRQFVEYVSEAHSWYKHLPLLQPGAPFWFFLDPMVAHDHVLLPDGQAQYQQRTVGTETKFHYTWMTTNEYIARHGYLNYGTDAAPSFYIGEASQLRKYSNKPYFVYRNVAYTVPNEILSSSEVLLTAVVHPLSSRKWVWDALNDQTLSDENAARSAYWPIETGGSRTIRRILGACDQEGWILSVDQVDARIDSLIRRERERLKNQFLTAVECTVSLLFDG